MYLLLPFPSRPSLFTLYMQNFCCTTWSLCSSHAKLSMVFKISCLPLRLFQTVPGSGQCGLAHPALPNPTLADRRIRQSLFQALKVKGDFLKKYVCLYPTQACLNTKGVATEVTMTHIRQAACSCLSDQLYTMTKLQTPEGFFS